MNKKTLFLNINKQNITLKITKFLYILQNFLEISRHINIIESLKCKNHELYEQTKLLILKLNESELNHKRGCFK